MTEAVKAESESKESAEPPVFCNLLRGPVQPVLVSSQPYHFDDGKPFRRVRGRIAQRHQLAHGHQNLNVILREAGQSRRGCDIKACR